MNNILGSGSVHSQQKYAKKPAKLATAANIVCQKCLQSGHWTYECKNAAVYQARPSRTKQLKDPKRKQRFLDPSQMLPEMQKDVKDSKQQVAAKKKRKRAETSSSSSDSSDSDSDSSSSDSSSSDSSSSSDDSSSSSSDSDSSSSGSSDSDSSSSSSSDSDTPPPSKKNRKVPQKSMENARRADVSRHREADLPSKGRDKERSSSRHENGAGREIHRGHREERISERHESEHRPSRHERDPDSQHRVRIPRGSPGRDEQIPRSQKQLSPRSASPSGSSGSDASRGGANERWQMS